MADSPFKGLLYSPEVLGGIGLLTAGLSGQNPGVALPQLMQGMKTASMFKAMEEEEEEIYESIQEIWPCLINESSSVVIASINLLASS